MDTENKPRFRESLYCQFTRASVGEKGMRGSVHFASTSYVDKDGSWCGGGYRVAISALEKRIKNIEAQGGIADESIKALEAARAEFAEARRRIASESYSDCTPV
jgi:hypothetical protein